ncbi:hypothetical protein [Caenimonas sedimenti]|uniref:hypothetical protein n=1 Tax=Caenimonas sedimenti TaxID=2596921 RepID=UPI0016441AE2|nr:hypothetical protein [Caenimonas sedimenti]
MAVRKNLLDRELKKLAARHGSAQRDEPSSGQQQGQAGHPSADQVSRDEHAG